MQGIGKAPDTIAGPSPWSLMVVEVVVSSSAYVVSKVAAQDGALQLDKELSFCITQTHRSRADGQLGGIRLACFLSMLSFVLPLHPTVGFFSLCFRN